MASSNMTYQRAIERFQLMLKNNKHHLDERGKAELQHVIVLLREGEGHEAYMFVNYYQWSELEYLMPYDLWTWLINQQNRTTSIIEPS